MRCRVEDHVTEKWVTLDTGERFHTGDDHLFLIYPVGKPEEKQILRGYNGITAAAGDTDCYTYKSDTTNGQPHNRCWSMCDFYPEF